MEQFKNRIDLSSFSEKIENLRSEIKKTIVGQEKMIDYLLIALLAKGHVLIEGVPGLAKTLSARLLARTIDVDFKRIQFTPDLLPSDIIGTSVFNTKESVFHFHKGPLFSNIVLADEINRSPAKTQSALFEAMEERQITADGTTYPLQEPFLVLATQNPVDLEGTYRLPEAQIDRFLFKIVIDYPTLENEIEILTRAKERKGDIDMNTVKKILKREDLKEIYKTVSDILVDESIIRYIARIVLKTRDNPDLYLAASPRASLAIMAGAKAFAALNGRDFVTPDDVKYVVPPALIHRLVLSPEKELDGSTVNDVIEEVLRTVEIPR